MVAFRLSEMKEDCSMQTDQHRKMSFCQRSSACSLYDELTMVSWTQVTTTSLRRDRPSLSTLYPVAVTVMVCGRHCLWTSLL